MMWWTLLLMLLASLVSAQDVIPGGGGGIPPGGGGGGIPPGGGGGGIPPGGGGGGIPPGGGGGGIPPGGGGGGIPPGGRSRILEPRTQQYDQMAWRAAKKITSSSRFSSGSFHWLPVRITEAHSQVVSGYKYYLDLVVAQSRCTKDKIPSDQLTERKVYSECGLHHNPQFRKCKVEIWTQAWLDFEEITITECVRTSFKDAIPILM